MLMGKTEDNPIEFPPTETTKILVLTDLHQKKYQLDVPLIVNFDLPRNYGNYVLRSGKQTNRLFVSLVTNTNIQELKEIEQFYCTSIQELPADAKLT
jgi:superfamily II DNA/RNA helicase